MAALDAAIQEKNTTFLEFGVDCWVKPGHDNGWPTVFINVLNL